MHDPSRSHTAIHVVGDGKYSGDHEEQHKQRIDGEVTMRDEHPRHAVAARSTYWLTETSSAGCVSYCEAQYPRYQVWKTSCIIYSVPSTTQGTYTEVVYALPKSVAAYVDRPEDEGPLRHVAEE